VRSQLKQNTQIDFVQLAHSQWAAIELIQCSVQHPRSERDAKSATGSVSFRTGAIKFVVTPSCVTRAQNKPWHEKREKERKREIERKKGLSPRAQRGALQ